MAVCGRDLQARGDETPAMEAISQTPGARASQTAHSFERASDLAGFGTLAVAGLARATHPLHAMSAAVYAGGVAAGVVSKHPHAAAIAGHAGGVAEGVGGAIYALRKRGHAAHGASPGGVRGMLGSAAGIAGKALPAIAATVGVVDVATTLDDFGPSGLLHTHRGRGGVLSALGGALILVPHPAAKLAGAGAMAAALANDLGAARRFDAERSWQRRRASSMAATASARSGP